MDDHGNQRAIEQELRDERARRREAESRLDDLTERAELWRSRAEERTERIERLLAAQRRKGNTLRRWARAVRGDSDDEVPSEPADDDVRAATPSIAPPSRAPGMKSTLVVSSITDAGMARALAVFDEYPLTSSGDADLDRADFVVIEPGSLETLDSASRDRLAEWSRRPARQPILIWTRQTDVSPVTRLVGDDVVIAASDAEIARVLDVPFLPGCFDPARHHPGRPGPGQSSLEGASLGSPSLDTIERAASGQGVSPSPGAGTAARRWAYRHHAPWVRGEQLLRLAGVSGRSPIPAIAAVLVSHRSEDVPTAVSSLLRQTHRPFEMLVALHGEKITNEIEASVSDADMPVTLLELDRDLTLGECLNLAAAETSAPILAKIDDDDHYGPAHLEDSFHALCYSGADIVGKGTHFTYLAAQDTTVLRRPGMEETFTDGSPNGATLVFRREVWEGAGFPHRPRHVDTGFLRAARRNGASVYVSSHWEFCYVRRSEGHTWDAEDEVFLAGSEPAWDGYQPDRVEVADVEPV